MELSRNAELRISMPAPLCSRGYFCLFIGLLLFSLWFVSFIPSSARAAVKSDEEVIEELLKQREEKLWRVAHNALNAGKEQDAALAFWRYWRKYPDSLHNAEALWQAANLYRNLAFVSRDPDWQRVADLFRSFTTEHPESLYLAEAYYQVGYAQFQEGYFREALTYFSLFIKRYPKHPLVNTARYMKAQCLMKIGRLDKARQVYKELSGSKDTVFALRGQTGEGHIYFAKDKFHDALGTYLKILRRNPSFYIHDLQTLRNMGIAYIRVGSDEEGREKLLHYLNLSGPNDSRPDVLFELAESYLKAGEHETARKFFARVVDEGKKTDKFVTLSLFRLAQEKDRQKSQRTLDEEEKKVSSTEDKPFREVLDRHYSEPLSQDARLDLMKRHWLRQEYDEAYILGKAYLRHETTESGKKEMEDIMGRILELKAAELFQLKKYDKIYEFYQNEYPYVASYTRGKLLFLVGRALEEMSLFKQAGVVYYRALALELTDLEKRDLYIHRALSYLSDNDQKSAQRLLKYLRKIYADDNFMGEICFLSGKLREMQERPEDALKFYQMAVDRPTLDDKKDQYATSYLRMLFDQDQIDENAGVLDTFQKEKWLTPAELQKWYLKLGDYYRQADELTEAKNAYQQALSEEMPTGNKNVPMIQVYLGDVLYRLGLTLEGLELYEKALAGSNGLAAKMARERLDQEKIKKALRESEAVLNN